MAEKEKIDNQIINLTEDSEEPQGHVKFEIVRPHGSLGILLTEVDGEIRVQEIDESKAPKDVKDLFQLEDKIVEVNGTLPFSIEGLHSLVNDTSPGQKLAFAILRKYKPRSKDDFAEQSVAHLRMEGLSSSLPARSSVDLEMEIVIEDEGCIKDKGSSRKRKAEGNPEHARPQYTRPKTDCHGQNLQYEEEKSEEEINDVKDNSEELQVGLGNSISDEAFLKEQAVEGPGVDSQSNANADDEETEETIAIAELGTGADNVYSVDNFEILREGPKEEYVCIDEGLIEQGHFVFFRGKMKRLDDTGKSKQVLSSRLTEWQLEGLGKSEDSVFHILTDFAEYILNGRPSENYALQWEKTKFKAFLLKVVINYCVENPGALWEDLSLEVERSCARSKYDQRSGEEIMIDHVTYLLDQIWDSDQVLEDLLEERKKNGDLSTEEDEIAAVPLVYNTPAIQHLVSLEGFSSRKRKQRRAGAQKTHLARNLHAGRPATTTPLVQEVFEDFFKHQLTKAGTTDTSWYRYIISLVGEKVHCQGSPDILGTLAFDNFGAPCVQLGYQKQDLDEFESESEACDSQILSLTEFLLHSKCYQEDGKKVITLKKYGKTLEQVAVEKGWKESCNVGAGKRQFSSSDFGQSSELNLNNDFENLPVTWVPETPSSIWRTEDGLIVQFFNEASGVGSDGFTVRPGDCVIATFEITPDDVIDIYCRVVAMWNQNDQHEAIINEKGLDDKSSENLWKKGFDKFYGITYVRACDTVLETSANGAELFLQGFGCELPFSSIHSKIEIYHQIDPEPNWENLGNATFEERTNQKRLRTVGTSAATSKSKIFFCQKMYRFSEKPQETVLRPLGCFKYGCDLRCARFIDLPKFMYDENRSTEVIRECLPSISSLKTSEELLLAFETKLRIGDISSMRDWKMFLIEAHSKLASLLHANVVDASSSKRALIRGSCVEVGNFVYLQPYSFKHNQVKQINNGDGLPHWVEEEEKQRLDREKYPEIARKLKPCRIFIKEIQPDLCIQPYQIARVQKITTEYGKIELKVTKLYRPEDTSLMEKKNFPLRLLFWSNEAAYVTEDQFISTVRVFQLSRSEDCWQHIDEEIFYFQHSYVARNPGPGDVVDVPENLCPSLTEYIGKKKPPQLPELDTLDLFCGAGGMSLGLEQAGACRSKWAVDFDKDAVETYKANFPQALVFKEDCNDFLKKVKEYDKKPSEYQSSRYPKKGDVKVIVCGPPCQGYSGLNRFSKREYSQFKNSLVVTCLGLCDFFRPNLFILENVKSFGNYAQGTVLQMSIRALVEMGYQCTFGCLQAGSFGVPQSRKRLFIIAAAPGHVLPEFPQPTHCVRDYATSLKINGVSYNPTCCTRLFGQAPFRRTTIKDAIADLPFIPREAITMDKSLEEMEYKPMDDLSEYQRQMRGKLNGDKRFKIFNHVVKCTNSVEIARFESIPKWPGADWRNMPNVEKVINLRPNFRKLLKKLQYASKMSSSKRKNTQLIKGKQKDTFIPWFLPNSAHKNGNWAGMYGRLSMNGAFSTVTTNPTPSGKQGRVIHPDQDRVVSVRECGRAQGFPDHFIFKGLPSDQYRQVGNAVPPLLSKAIGFELNKTIFKNHVVNKRN